MSARRIASTSNASPARIAVASPYCAQTDGSPRRSLSLSSDGRSSCTSENECTSSTAAAAGSRFSIVARSRRRWPGRAPAGRASRRARGASAPRATRGRASARARRDMPSTSARSSLSRLRHPGSAAPPPRSPRALRALQLGLDFLRELRELLQDLDRLIGVLASRRAVRGLASSRASRSSALFSDSSALMLPPPVGSFRVSR